MVALAVANSELHSEIEGNMSIIRTPESVTEVDLRAFMITSGNGLGYIDRVGVTGSIPVQITIHKRLEPLRCKGSFILFTCFAALIIVHLGIVIRN